MASKAKNLTDPTCRAQLSYPIELKLAKQRVVIIGGGHVGRRKLPDLLAAGAYIDVVDPLPLIDFPQHPQLRRIQRAYQPEDLGAARLVFATTDNARLNAQIAEDAEAANILCCRGDSAAHSHFTCPARLQRPPLTFTLSSGGKSPAILPVLRDLLDEMIPSSWQIATELAAAIRRKVLTEEPSIPYNQQVLLKLIEQGLLGYLENSDIKSLDHLLFQHFGAGFTLKDLHFQFPEGTS